MHVQQYQRKMCDSVVKLVDEVLEKNRQAQVTYWSRVDGFMKKARPKSNRIAWISSHCGEGELYNPTAITTTMRQAQQSFEFKEHKFHYMLQHHRVVTDRCLYAYITLLFVIYNNLTRRQKIHDDWRAYIPEKMAKFIHRWLPAISRIKRRLQWVRFDVTVVHGKENKKTKRN